MLSQGSVSVHEVDGFCMIYFHAFYYFSQELTGNDEKSTLEFQCFQRAFSLILVEHRGFEPLTS